MSYLYNIATFIGATVLLLCAGGFVISCVGEFQRWRDDNRLTEYRNTAQIPCIYINTHYDSNYTTHDCISSYRFRALKSYRPCTTLVKSSYFYTLSVF